MDLNDNIIFSLINSEDEFPVDFNSAWKWIGYTRKDNAKSALLGAGFIREVDFGIFLNDQENSKVGRPSEKIMLTVDCFKSFCMMAGTIQGRKVREYFLECEKELKRRILEERNSRKSKIIDAVVDEQHSIWSKKFEDSFFEEAYRVTGWNKTQKGHPSCMGYFINTSIYDLFPEGVTDKLREINPVTVSGSRSRKHHQYLTENLGIPLLDYQKAVAMTVMRLSPPGSMKRFKENMQKACGTFVQIELQLENLN